MSSLPKQWHLVPIERAGNHKDPGSIVGKGWQLKASNDPSQIERWKEDNPECNWGLLLGPKSGVIDVEADCEEGNKLLNELCRDVETVSYRSKKSVHRLFRYDVRMRELELKSKFTHKDIEFRIGQDGGQSVIPPSVHESGIPYTWIVAPDECEIAELPSQLWEIIHEHLEAKEKAKAAKPIDAPTFTNVPTEGAPGKEFQQSERGLHRLLTEMQRDGYAIRQKGDFFEFDRPGKESANSCSGHVGKRSTTGNYQLTNWSTNDPHFQPDETISIFRAFAQMRCGGDLSLASQQLRGMGFGDQLEISPDIDFENLNRTPPHQTAKSGATTCAVSLLDDYASKLDAGQTSKLLSFGEALDGIEVGPELVTIFGSPPGSGKTTLAMQLAFEAIERDRNLRVVVANAETSFAGLLRRELARITGIDGNKIRFGNLTSSERNQINRALGQIRERVGRMEVLDEPSTFAQLQQITGEPGLLVVDYLQKFSPPSGDIKAGITSLMNLLRSYAKAGWAVVVLSATSRPKDGAKTQDTSQFVFRDSSEIEFNGDSCYVIRDDGPIDGDEQIRNVTLVHAKNRHGAKQDRGLVFNMKRSCFEIGLNVNFDELDNSNPFATGGVK
jgi:hypothetical protein